MTASIPPVLADQYDIIRELGSGGMATVFLAHDRKHDRHVAVKVIRHAFIGSTEADRFRREIAFAARLQHPHLLPVYDSGTTDGLLWYTMPYVEGETLRERLRREVQLPVSEAVRIGRETASALAYAHAHGVLHRDVKPENILLDAGGRAMLADFGIARAAAGGNAGATLTATGTSVGTPAYMSPEQAAGEGAVDARSDVYALGCVLYELLAGEQPFTGPTPQAVIAKRFAVTPPSLRVVREGVPPALDAAIARAMCRAPADRFQTVAAFGEALAGAEAAGAVPNVTPAGLPNGVPGAAGPTRRAARLAALAAGVVALAAAGAVVARRLDERPAAPATDPAPAPSATSVAVLPFENVGTAPDSAFADALADEVRGKLAAIPALHVIASTSSARYRGRTVSDEQIGKALGVRYLVVGRVRWSTPPGGRVSVRVEPELVQVGGVSVPVSRWAEPLDGTLDDVFALQSEIASRVVQKLGVVLAAADSTRLRRAPTRSLDAYQAYLRGRAVAIAQGGSQAGLRAAVTEYDRAVTLDPDYPLAWAAMSSALSQLYSVASPPDPAVAARAQAALDRAQALAPTLPDVFRARGMFASRVLKDQRRALDAYREGLRAAPNDVSLLAAAAVTHLALDGPDSAATLLRAAQRVDPLAPAVAVNRLQTALRVRDSAEAREAGDRALALAPASLTVRQFRAMAELQRGDLRAARAIVASTPPSVARAALAAYMATYQDLYWVLEDAEQRTLLALTPADFDGDRAGWALALAATHALRGDRVRARALADTARAAVDAQLRGSPDDAVLHATMAVALGFRGAPGDSAAAVREGELAATLAPLDHDTWTGGYIRYQLARAYTLVGDRPRATALLAQLLRVPYLITPGWLRVDPSFRALDGDPAFARLAADR